MARCSSIHEVLKPDQFKVLLGVDKSNEQSYLECLEVTGYSV